MLLTPAGLCYNETTTPGNEEPAAEKDGSMTISLKNIPAYVKYLRKGYYIPREIEAARRTDQEMILHVSDTPSSSYPSLLELIETLKPEIIIHTGDLVDDVKLELYPDAASGYREKAAPFLQALRITAAEDIYIVPGNHDAESILTEEAGRIHIVPAGTAIQVKGRKLGLAHYREDLPNLTDFGLYGHNLTAFGGNNIHLLNGCKTINIIIYPSWQVFNLPYPLGTNHERQFNSLSGRQP